jgi:4-hydroxy-tetrahydrodipicolinate reductase
LIKIAVPGVNGRMGSAIAAQILQDPALELAVVTARPDSPNIATKYLNTDLLIAENLQGSNFEVLIDFSNVTAAMQHLEYCLEHKIAMVIGVTGFSPDQLQQIQQAALQIPILLSSNMSVGVNICYRLLEQAAKLFDASWQVNISDLHHQHKKDSPSGTAKQMAQIIAKTRGIEPSEVAIKSERYGEVAGSHAITFSNESESVTLMHIANNRTIFAVGAVDAAKWLNKRAPGLYSMQDVI